MRRSWTPLFLALFVLAAPSTVAPQIPSTMWPTIPIIQPGGSNPLFPERVGPWIAVPQFSGCPQLSAIPSRTPQPLSSPLLISPISPRRETKQNQFLLPMSLRHLPLPPNPIVERLYSFGFLLQVPVIKSPLGNSLPR